jgi:hypothetical protein
MEPFEAPSTQLTNERLESLQGEVFMYGRHEEFFIYNLPGSSMRLVGTELGIGDGLVVKQ